MIDFITTHNLVKDYKGTRALNNVSVTIPRGSVYGLLGPNGAGKTTLIRILNQILVADSGSVLLDGQLLKPDHISRFGYLPEERGLYKKMKVGEQALYLAQLKGLTRYEAGIRLKSWFDRLDMGSWWNRNVEELSKGMQQKVQFIVTVLHNPDVLILDEPFSGFDPINANIIKQEIIELKKQGTTILLSTHNMSSVEELCDSIALLHRGNKLLEGRVRDIKVAYASSTYVFTYSGWFDKLACTLTPDYEITGLRNDEHTTSVTLRLSSPMTPNSLVSHMLQFGNLVSFHEELPSMNEIFITAVGKTQPLENV